MSEEEAELFYKKRKSYILNSLNKIKHHISDVNDPLDISFLSRISQKQQ